MNRHGRHAAAVLGVAAFAVASGSVIASPLAGVPRRTSCPAHRRQPSSMPTPSCWAPSDSVALTARLPGGTRMRAASVRHRHQQRADGPHRVPGRCRHRHRHAHRRRPDEPDRRRSPGSGLRRVDTARPLDRGCARRRGDTSLGPDRHAAPGWTATSAGTRTIRLRRRSPTRWRPSRTTRPGALYVAVAAKQAGRDLAIVSYVDGNVVSYGTIASTLPAGVPTVFPGAAHTAATVVTATEPVMVAHTASGTTDAVRRGSRDRRPLVRDPLHAASDRVRPGRRAAGLTESDGGSPGIAGGRGDQVVRSGGGSQGTGPAVIVAPSAGGSLAAIQQAESDGGESSVYWPESELNPADRVATLSQYVAIALSGAGHGQRGGRRRPDRLQRRRGHVVPRKGSGDLRRSRLVDRVAQWSSRSMVGHCTRTRRIRQATTKRTCSVRNRPG